MPFTAAVLWSWWSYTLETETDKMLVYETLNQHLSLVHIPRVTFGNVPKNLSLSLRCPLELAPKEHDYCQGCLTVSLRLEGLKDRSRIMPFPRDHVSTFPGNPFALRLREAFCVRTHFLHTPSLASQTRLGTVRYPLIDCQQSPALCV
jgi:hypothetical protein